MNDKTSILQHELDEVKSQIMALEEATHAQPNYGLGQGDPAITRREVDRALLERLKEREKALQQAIAEINQGNYGLCQECGTPIHPERLAILPDTQVCIRCAQATQPAH